MGTIPEGLNPQQANVQALLQLLLQGGQNQAYGSMKYLDPGQLSGLIMPGQMEALHKLAPAPPPPADAKTNINRYESNFNAPAPPPVGGLDIGGLAGQAKTMDDDMVNALTKLLMQQFQNLRQ